MRGTIVIWDMDDDPDGNVQHVLEHDLCRAEVDDVLLDPQNQARRSETSDRPCTFGWTSTGRHIIVIFELVDVDPYTVYPVTAYEAPPPTRRRARRRR